MGAPALNALCPFQVAHHRPPFKGRTLGRVLLAAELAETLTDQAFFGQKTHERDGQGGLVAVHRGQGPLRGFAKRAFVSGRPCRLRPRRK